MADVKRKPNFSAVENACLVDVCVERLPLLYNEHVSPDRFWADVSEKVNCVGGGRRSGEDVKKKWKDLKSSTKKKEQARRRDARKTGGGAEPKALKDIEEKILLTIPQAALSGVEGGMDIFQDTLHQLQEEPEQELADEPTEAHELQETIVVLHPQHINVEGPQQQQQPQQHKRKRVTPKDVLEAQYNFFMEEAKTSKAKRAKYDQQCRMFTTMERYYSLKTKSMQEAEQ